jgi:hypothetical protein
VLPLVMIISVYFFYPEFDRFFVIAIVASATLLILRILLAITQSNMQMIGRIHDREMLAQNKYLIFRKLELKFKLKNDNLNDEERKKLDNEKEEIERYIEYVKSNPKNQ